MSADPLYARSRLAGTNATPDVAPPVAQDGSPPTEAAPSEPPSQGGQPPEPDAGVATKPAEGEPPAVDPGTQAPGPTEAAGGEPAPPPEKAPPAEMTPEQKIAQAEELIKMARDEPAKFAAEHNIDMAPRFAKLGQQAQELRRKEAAVKEMEAASAAKIKEAEEAIELLGRDRVGFVEKYLGKDGMAKLNRAALAKDDPQYAVMAKLEDLVDAQNSKIEELTAKLGKPAEPQLSDEETARANAHFEQKAHEFATDYKQLAQHPENQRLITFFGEDAVRDDALELVNSMYRSTRRELTADEVWSMLRTEFDERYQKISGTAPPAGTPTTQTPQASSEPGPDNGTATPDVGLPAETDFSPAAERRRMAAIAARHTKA